MASSLIDEFIGNRPMEKQLRTEYYNGTGTQKITLNARPAFETPTPQVAINEAGFWGEVSGGFTTPGQIPLVYGTDFALAIDDFTNRTSRSGILVRCNNYWPRPRVRSWGLLTPYLGESFGAVQVIYTGGYTIDTLPAAFRLAANLLVGKLRYIIPMSMQLTSESYEDRAVAFGTQHKTYLLDLVKPILLNYKNWAW